MKNYIKNIFKFIGIYSIIHILYRKILERKNAREFPSKRLSIIKNYNEEHKFINIGGGNFLKENWRVLDYISTQYHYDKRFIDFNINLLENNQWQIESSSYDLAYSSHCLEHLTNEAGLFTFKEIHRILKSGGIFRITLPDIDIAYKAYAEKDLAFFKDNVNARDSSSIQSYFLDFFTNQSANELDLDIFEEDFRDLKKEEFLNKYIPKSINVKTHDFSKHINWYNKDKLDSFALVSGFSQTISSKRRGSISEEMRSFQFDHKPGEYCIYLDIIK